MLDDEPGNPPGADPGTRGQGTERDDSATVVIGATADDGLDRNGGDGGHINVGLDPGDDLHSDTHASLSIGFGDVIDDDDVRGLPAGDAAEHDLGFSASPRDLGELDVELSPWAPLLGMLESTEPEVSPGDRPFTPGEGAEGAHALELRAESMRQYAERGAVRTGALDRTEVGDSDDNRDVVAGRDEVDVGGMLDEHTGHGLVVVADEVEMNVGGPLTMHAHLEDNIIMAGVMRDEFEGGTFITAAMSDDMAAGVGLRCTAPLDVWVHGLVGMEERPGTCAADLLLSELAGTLYEREYGPSAHVAAVARLQGTTVTTMKSGFRPLMKVALGVRNLIPGGGGGGGSANASPPAAPPVPPGGEAAGTLQSVGESGGALVRGGADSGDTDDIVSVVRTVENTSDTADVENLQHPASTADNLDDLARVDAEGGGYRQVAEATDQPVPPAAASEPDAGAVSGADSASPASGYKKAPELDLTEPGADGYTFENSYGKLREQVEHFRADSNWRGNLYSREYLTAVDDKASDLFKAIGGDPMAFAGDNRNYRTAEIYAAMQKMLDEAAEAERYFDVAEIRTVMEELEGFVHGSAVDFAARTDEFAGTAFGSQRLAIDPNIDTEKLRTWLQEQVSVAQEKFFAAQMAGDQAGWTHANWEVGFYDQVLKSLDAGMNPLAESSEQTIFIQAAKVMPENEKYIAQTTADIIALGLDPNDFDIIPPRAADQDQLDAFLEFHDRFVETLSDPEFHRSAAEVGDSYAPALHGPGGPGPDQPGPGSLGPPAGAVDEPDVHPVVGAGDPPPPPPDNLVSEVSPGAGPSETGGTRSPAEPPELYATHPGADGYQFSQAYDSVHKRNVYYREEFLFRGNFFTREYLKEIDAKAWRAVQRSSKARPVRLPGDNFGNARPRASTERSADDGHGGGRGRRHRVARPRSARPSPSSRASWPASISELASRADEFSGAAVGSQRAPIDRAHRHGRSCGPGCRNGCQHALKKCNSAVPLDEPTRPRQRAGPGRWGYYLVPAHDARRGRGPPGRLERADRRHPHQQGRSPPRAVRGRDCRQQPLPPHTGRGRVSRSTSTSRSGLLATLADSEFHRSIPDADGSRRLRSQRRTPPRIEAGLDVPRVRLAARPVRLAASPRRPCPRADFADGAVYVDEVRDRSFCAKRSRRERGDAGAAGGRSRPRGTPPFRAARRFADSTPPESSFGTRLAPPDGTRAPIIDELSGQMGRRAARGARCLPGIRARYLHPRARGFRPAADIRCGSWESGTPGVRRLRSRSRRRRRRRCRRLRSLQGGVRARGRGPGGCRRDAACARPRTTTKPPARRPRCPDGAGGEDANPVRHRLRAGRFHHHLRLETMLPVRVVRARRHPSAGTRSTRFPTGAPSRPAGHRHHASRRHGGGCGPQRRRHSFGPLRRARVHSRDVRSKGRSRSDDPKELARSIDGAEIPVEDLLRVEPDAANPGRRSILESSDGTPVSDNYRGRATKSEIQRRLRAGGIQHKSVQRQHHR